MAFVKKYAFQIAILCLCLLMGGYLLKTYVFKTEPPLTVKQAAPNFALKDLEDNIVTLESTNGKARIVYFYFANCPDVCPPTTFLLSQVQDILKKDGDLGNKIELISITLDPERDTPDVIREFAQETSVDFEHWQFLRAETIEETIQLAKEFGVAVIYDKENETFIHTNPITVVDADGNVREWINASPNLEYYDDITPEDVVKTVKRIY